MEPVGPTEDTMDDAVRDFFSNELERQERNLSWLSKRTGIAYMTLRNHFVLRNRQYLPLDIAAKVAEAFGYSLSYVLAQIEAQQATAEPWRDAFAKVLSERIYQTGVPPRIKGVKHEDIEAAIAGSPTLSPAMLRMIGVGLGVSLAVVDQYVPGRPGRDAADSAGASSADLG